ncbi:MAG: DNA recombination protein RmuC [Chlamydiae bacterium]|nr:DNA recombination protein RmuC [Chlamydiota bacterium]
MWIPLCLIVLASLVIIYFFKKSTSLEKEVLSLRLEKEELKLYARELEVLQGVDAGKLHEREQLAQQFKILSYEALEQTQKKFLEGAKGQLDQAFTVAVAPIRETLHRFDQKVGELEKSRLGDHVSLTEQIKALLLSQGDLRKETQNLVGALRAPNVRGQWGEMQLKRVVELAGMLNYCDFIEQESSYGETGRLRPDLVIKLPGGRQVVVDAKAPLKAYLESHSAENEDARELKNKELAAHVRAHIKALSDKKYWEQFQPAPEFVILFIPGETFFSAALQADPSLIEVGVEKRVLLATPTTLIALLKAISYGWRQELLSANAEELSKKARELYKRLKDFTTHLSKVGKHLSSAVHGYNDAVGSFEARVLSTARRFSESEALLADDVIDPLKHVVDTTRHLKEFSENTVL